MKKRTSKLLSLLLTLTMVVGMLSMGQVAYAAGDLQNVSISSEGVLRWDAFPGADSYKIKSGAIEEISTSTSLDLYDLFAEKRRSSGTWWVEVWAESSGTQVSEKPH